MGSLIAASQAKGVAGQASNMMGLMGALTMGNNAYARNSYQSFDDSMGFQWGQQAEMIRGLLGPKVTDFRIGPMPGVETSPLGDQSPANVGRSWLGGK